MKDWIKLHTEILHDLKFKQLSTLEQLCCIKCFLVAGEMNQGGLLPDLPLLADEINCSVEDTMALMVKLEEFRIVICTEKGYIVKNFEKRQGKITSSKERTRRYRAKATKTDSCECDRCDAENVTKSTDSCECDRCDAENVTKEEKEKKQEKKRTKRKELKKEKEELINININKDLINYTSKEELINININKDLINPIGININNTFAQKSFFVNSDEEKRGTEPVKRKLQPTDHDYWRCFGDNAGLAETFYQETGIAPVKSEFGRWRKDLNLFREIGCSEAVMTKAIHRLQQQGMTIGAPGSAFKTARALLQSKKTAVPPNQDFYSILKGLNNDKTGNDGDFGDVGGKLLAFQEPRSSP